MVINMEEHKRRPRYKGTHPRKFEEKYKELNPEKYADTVAKVISKGSTPAGMHISIMVKEILDFLQIQPGQKGLDATLGYGGRRICLADTTKFYEFLDGFRCEASSSEGCDRYKSWVIPSVNNALFNQLLNVSLTCYHVSQI